MTSTTRQRTAIYLRVSTSGQTTENQRMELERICEARGWPIVAVYEDAGISGAKGRDQRPQLDKMLKDATRRKFDRIVVWSADRLGRSTALVSALMVELDGLGVAQFYLKEGIDTSTPHGRAMIQMAAVFAELERGMIRERVNAGLDRARAQGKTLGRPTLEAPKADHVRSLLAAGKSIRKTAEEAGVSVGMVHKIKATATEAPQDA
jgi:DNA invertase Pin-like site-specific DNA recombinase